jgi:hypothetical protein
VLLPIFETIRLSKAQFYDFLRHLGNDELMKKVAAFLLEKWDTRSSAPSATGWPRSRRRSR